MEDITTVFVGVTVFYIQIHYDLTMLFNPLFLLASDCLVTPIPKESSPGSRLCLDLNTDHSGGYSVFYSPQVPLRNNPRGCKVLFNKQ